MIGPERPLPHHEGFASAEAYVDELLNFSSTSDLFQILCGGVHVLDFFTREPSLFYATLPEEWHPFLLSCDIMRLLDLLLRDDLNSPATDMEILPPHSLIAYVKSIRRLSLRRDHDARAAKLPALPRPVAVGMKPKKVHEVTSFADYVQTLSDNVQSETGTGISHFVDFGSGQNYLGRALASEPYNRRVVAVEGRENNVAAAKGLDMVSGLATKQTVMRNKKLYNKLREEATGSDGKRDEAALEAAFREATDSGEFDFRPLRELVAQYSAEEGKGSVQYVSGRLDSGELADVISQIDQITDGEAVPAEKSRQLMAVSIHSCGNLSHYGIRSLVLNPDIRAVAIVGCCYNLMTERLGPPSYKHQYLRPTLQALNGRVKRESERRDPEGFPMSEKFATYNDQGIRLNVTARMMACQAPSNWNRAESESFFTRHFYRAVLQKIFLDRGVVSRINHRNPEAGNDDNASAFDVSTSPVTIGSLRKSCYKSFSTYVRGVVEKLTSSTDHKQYAEVMRERMADITDAEIEGYEATYGPRKKEICIMWTMMAFSAVVAESLIVSDRWTFLKEQVDTVKEAWVETVFDFAQSPRNLVVVGIKK